MSFIKLMQLGFYHLLIPFFYLFILFRVVWPLVGRPGNRFLWTTVRFGAANQPGSGWLLFTGSTIVSTHGDSRRH